jgi:DNA-binding response OmpR family regulator
VDKEVRRKKATEGNNLVTKRSVLVVDRSEETREVLTTALERRGWRTFAASRAQRGLELAREHRPDLIVLDLEIDESPPEVLYEPFARETAGRHTPLLVLSGVRRGKPALKAAEIVSKPYHYGPLIRRIEELLDASERALARSA